MSTTDNVYYLPPWILLDPNTYPYPVHLIPRHILFQTFCKMAPFTLCRLRQTCLEMNNVIESNNKSFSTLPGIGVNIMCGVVKNAMSVYINGRDFKLSSGWKWRISGISIHKISMAISDPKMSLFNYLANFFEDLKPKCDLSEMVVQEVQPHENLLRILNSISVRTGQIFLDSLENPTSFCDLFKDAAFSSNLIYGQRRLFQDNFHVVKNFKAFMVHGGNHSAIDFVTLLLSIVHSRDVGTIEEIKFEANLSQVEKFQEFPWFDQAPRLKAQMPYKTLWDACSPNEEIPYNIYLMKAGGKYLVISVKGCCPRKGVTINFELNMQNVLNRILIILQIQKFSESCRREFLNSNIQQQSSILLAAFSEEH